MSFFHRRSLVAAGIALGLTVAAPTRASMVTADQMGLGDPHAKVTVIEYGSASCPHCAHFNNDIFPAFRAKYVATGRAYYVFREFITPPENLAVASFLIARCAGPDRYFSVLDAIFHAQADIYKTGDAAGILGNIAKNAGMTESQTKACLANKTAFNALVARVTRFSKVDKINSTPTFIVNGERIQGVESADELGAAVERAEAKAHR